MSDLAEDIRTRPCLEHEDILGLNFIRAPGRYRFRRHYRAGLRSHIMEVLCPEEARRERQGVILGGLKRFPRARPRRMLRIFRTRFGSLDEALEETRRVKVIQRYLGPAHVARSDEFLVDYAFQGGRELLLCGLQEYVPGEILDPWKPLDRPHLFSLFERMAALAKGDPQACFEDWSGRLRESARGFISRTRQMVREAEHVPDLAGAGNLIITPAGDVKLVDINNISRIPRDGTLPVDDRGYPVCDKSIEALSLLEERLLPEGHPSEDPLYRPFLDPRRMAQVRALEKAFHLSMAPPPSPLGDDSPAA